MALSLYFKRAKTFIKDDEPGTVLTVTVSGADGPKSCPDWVKKTTTYTNGIDDGSILNLTPARGSSKKPASVVHGKAVMPKGLSR